MHRKASRPTGGLPVPRVPSLTHHKARDLAVVRINGKDRYCGKWGTAAAQNKYDRLIATWLANGRRMDDDATDVRIAELIDRYLRFADGYYLKGHGSGEHEPLRRALVPLGQMFGLECVADFGPLKLKALRQRWIDEGRVRKQINAATQRVVRCFKWGVENEIVPGEVYHALRAVAGLRAGRSAAKESAPILPVDDALVDPVLPFLTPPVRAMVELQRLSGMRPGEVVQVTPANIDRTGEVWTYEPARHKTQHHGRPRFVFFGPKCQAILLPFLVGRAPDAVLFSPADGLAAHMTQRTAKRRTPRNQGNKAGVRPAGRQPRAVRDRYDPEAYARAIVRACEKAFPPPERLARRRGESKADHRARLGESGWVELIAWRKAHHWYPNRLRHSFATRVRKAHGLEAAQILLGHARADVTQIYAERDASKAVSVAALIG